MMDESAATLIAVCCAAVVTLVVAIVIRLLFRDLSLVLVVAAGMFIGSLVLYRLRERLGPDDVS